MEALAFHQTTAPTHSHISPQALRGHVGYRAVRDQLWRVWVLTRKGAPVA